MAKALTFGDDFRLASRPGYTWNIRDRRGRTRGSLDTQTAYAVGGPGDCAEYSPGAGWVYTGRWVKCAEAITAELNALEVHLPGYTDEEWLALSFTNARRDATESSHSRATALREHAEYLGLSDEESAELLAHAAASYAVAAAGRDERDELYPTVYHAVVAARRESQPRT